MGGQAESATKPMGMSGENLMGRHEIGKDEKSASLQSSPFMQENFSAIINDAKPYRNIIKRYWTEEEVIITNNTK